MKKHKKYSSKQLAREQKKAEKRRLIGKAEERLLRTQDQQRTDISRYA